MILNIYIYVLDFYYYCIVQKRSYRDQLGEREGISWICENFFVFLRLGYRLSFETNMEERSIHSNLTFLFIHLIHTSFYSRYFLNVIFYISRKEFKE